MPWCKGSLGMVKGTAFTAFLAIVLPPQHLAARPDQDCIDTMCPAEIAACRTDSVCHSALNCIQACIDDACWLGCVPSVENAALAHVLRCGGATHCVAPQDVTIFQAKMAARLFVSRHG